MENIIMKIAARAGKLYTVKQPKDKNIIKVDPIKPYEVAKGPEQALADRNQASGAHVPTFRKEKTKQREKQEYRSFED